MDHFADIPTHSAKRHKSCRILSPSQNTLSDTQQYVTNTAKFCPPLKTYSQTLSNTSSILSNSVPQTINTQSAVSRFRSDRALEWITLWTSPRTMQNGTNIAKFCPPLKTYSQTLTNTSPILLNSVPLSKHTLRHSAIRHQSCQILSPKQYTRNMQFPVSGRTGL